jgi:hypothetical protein
LSIGAIHARGKQAAPGVWHAQPLKDKLGDERKIFRRLGGIGPR